jgi:hypothetical protein
MTDAVRPLDSDDIAWLDSYASNVEKTFSDQFPAAGNRLVGGEKLIGRFTEAMAAVKSSGRSHFHMVDEAHNELCVASSLLSGKKTVFATVEYEPPLPGIDQSIDLVARTSAGDALYVDVKTIKPALNDRWDQFEKIKREGKISPNVDVILSKGWLGGEIWHGMFASRARMLEYTVELEVKIRNAKLAAANAQFVMVFCGEGFHWHEDQLEDFVSFYQSGKHRADDALAAMEAWYVKENGVKFDGTISGFASLRRYQFEIQHQRLNWNVQPPSDGFGI